MTAVDLDVLVVGAGPTGLTTAALLARDGVRVRAITKYPGFANSPRAHIINQRTMEIFRDLGIAEEVTAAAMPSGVMGQVVWAESLTGREICRREGWGQGAAHRSAYALASPCEPTNIPQHILEPILGRAVQRFGGELVHQVELLTLTEHADHVAAVCLDRVTGVETVIRASYVVGADGDNSVVCRELGFDVVGASDLGHMLNFWVEADLTDLVAHRPGALFQVFRPGGVTDVDHAMFVSVQPWNEWVVAVPYDPAAGDPDRSAAAATRVLRRFTGDHTLRVRLIGSSTWTINQVHAEIMHHDRVVIAGNAAHRHPPAGGLGANTCVQDGYNLAWKLTALVRGSGGPALLPSFSAERAPIAQDIVARANRSLDALLAIPRALGLRPGLSEAEWNARMALRDAATPEGAAARTALAEALRMQDYNFNAIGVELGYHYDSALITSDGTRYVHSGDDALSYEMSTVPGAPLPHTWVGAIGERVSTRDLCGGGSFTLLTGVGGDRWRELARAAELATGVSVTVVSIGPGCDVEDPYGYWAELCDTTSDGAILVRPDLHVAYRANTLIGTATTALTTALQRALGHLTE